MSVKKAALVTVTLSSLLFQSGCSFLFVKGPPVKHAEMESFECSDSNAWPVVDLIWAGLNGIGAASAVGGEDMQGSEGTDPNTIIAVGVSWLLVSGISSIYGFHKVSNCKEAKRMHDRRAAPEEKEAPTPAPASAPVTPGSAPAPSVAPMQPPPAPAPASTPAAAPTPAPAPAAPAPPPAAPGPPSTPEH